MGTRRLSEDPVKARRQVFKRVYNAYFEWRSLALQGEIYGDHTLIMPTPIGEEIQISHLLVGLSTLSKKQREAFTYLCLEGMTESEAAQIMLPNSKWSTPVQQYSDTALDRMIKAYDLAQAGEWPPVKEQEQEATYNVVKERPLGRRQTGVLELLEQSSPYYKGCGWVYLSHSETVEILETLIRRRLVVTQEVTVFPNVKSYYLVSSKS